MLARNTKPAGGDGGLRRDFVVGSDGPALNSHFDRGVQVGVTRTLGAVMNGMLHDRRVGICGGCGRPLPEFDYLPDEMIQTPPVSAAEKKRRAELDRRVDIILRGGRPR